MKAKRNTDGEDFYWTTKKEVELPIFLESEGYGSESPVTLLQEFDNVTLNHGEKKALAYYDHGVKSWQYFTYGEMRQLVFRMSKAMIRLGVPARSCISILSYNRYEWNLAFWTAVTNNCIGFGIYMTNRPAECLHILNDSQSPLIFVENQIQYDKIIQIKKSLKYLKHIISFEPVKSSKILPAILFEDFLNLGGDVSPQIEIEFVSRRKNTRAGKCAALVYTSGTTGVSKGVMLSHDNITAIFHGLRVDNVPENPNLVSFLPASHVAALFHDVCMALHYKICVHFADHDALKGSLPFYLQSVRPDVFLGVPRVYEKIRSKIENQLKEANVLKRGLVGWARGVVRKEVIDVIDGKPPSTKFKIANRIFDKLKKKIGFENVMEFFSGAAPLKAETREFFLSMNIFINNIYGLSETTGGVSGLLPEQKKFYYAKSCGKPINGVECKIDPNSQEILFRARTCFMGYLNQKSKTKAVIDKNRFFHTGDLGKLNETNNLFIIGRLKEIIVTAGGENIAPYPIENKIHEKIKDFASWVVVVGDDRKYLSVLIVIRNAHDFTNVPSDEIEVEAKQALRKRGLDVNTISDLTLKPNFQKFSEIIQNAIDFANKHSVSRASKIRKWILLPRDFSIPTNEITPTMKLKRPKVELNFRKEINTLYGSPSL